jgi:hypothetical protein
MLLLMGSPLSYLAVPLRSPRFDCEGQSTLHTQRYAVLLPVRVVATDLAIDSRVAQSFKSTYQRLTLHSGAGSQTTEIRRCELRQVYAQVLSWQRAK